LDQLLRLLPPENRRGVHVRAVDPFVGRDPDADVVETIVVGPPEAEPVAGLLEDQLGRVDWRAVNRRLRGEAVEGDGRGRLPVLRDRERNGDVNDTEGAVDGELLRVADHLVSLG
jgi:hypothetical protein